MDANATAAHKLLARVLVTGATGLVGCRVVEKLVADGVDVVASGRSANAAEKARTARLESLGIDVVPGSITDPADCARMVAGCTHVIHLAAVQHEMNVPRRTFFEVNVEGTRNLLKASAHAGVARFVYGSTIGVYGDGGTVALDEDSPVAPLNEYGESKLAAEQAVQEWQGRMPASIARISETYGPGDERLLKLFRAVQAGRFMMIGNGLNMKQLIFVDDLVRGLLAMSISPAAEGEIFLLAGGEALTTREMVAHIGAAVGKTVSQGRGLPMWPFALAAAVTEGALRPLGIQPPIHRRRLDFFRKSFVISTRKAHAAFGYRPRYDFATGARITADWYRRARLL